jgi:hypothetical protein
VSFQPASIDLRLRVNGCTFPATQVGSSQVVLVESVALPEGPAEIVADIDGHEERWPVDIANRDQVRRVVPITHRQK